MSCCLSWATVFSKSSITSEAWKSETKRKLVDRCYIYRFVLCNNEQTAVSVWTLAAERACSWCKWLMSVSCLARSLSTVCSCCWLCWSFSFCRIIFLLRVKSMTGQLINTDQFQSHHNYSSASGWYLTQIFYSKGIRFVDLYPFSTLNYLSASFITPYCTHRLLTSCSSALIDAMWISNWAFSCVTFWCSALPFSTSTDCCFTRSSSSRNVSSWITSIHRNQ